MLSILAELDQAFRGAIHNALNLDADPQLGASHNDKFGDYQSNVAMGLVKLISEKTGKKETPRAIAEQIKKALDLGEMASEVTIAGPGFINVRLSPEWLSARLDVLASGPRLGIDPTSNSKTIVVDYSGPNVAKEMHVGHLRSTIIGDAIARVLEFEGHNVIRQNHIGDWGTQFGKVVLAIWYAAMAEANGESEKLRSLMERLQTALSARNAAAATVVREVGELHRHFIQLDPDGTRVFAAYLEKFPLDLPALERLYQFASSLMDVPEAKLEWIEHPMHGRRTLEELPRLFTKFIQHPEDPHNEQEETAWKKARAVTLDACYAIYRRLGAKLGPENERGESFYNPMLADVVKDLRAKGLAHDSEGAVAVFIDGADKPPLIIEKTDGGYLYGTTDLAGIRFRVNDLHANRIIYTHDSRQSQHFDQVFRVAHKAGWADGVQLDYAPFGTMLGEDGKPFKTRSGGTVKLKDLLDEAEDRAMRVVTEKNPELAEDRRKTIAHAVGIGGVKYADLSKDRNSDYMFSFDKMLALDGNTAPYLQYAHARIRSIFRKAGANTIGRFQLESPYELALAKHILRLGEIIDLVDRELKPHHLCTYLYDLAARFSGFYENCPVLQSEEPTRGSRLALADLAARTLEIGLDLLGIEHPDQM
ncbi:MAG: arginine--tRNA ligase [Planctomycetota bacterium]|nr:arginine--tRNA ligase [Planctomycetota bacterium]